MRLIVEQCHQQYGKTDIARTDIHILSIAVIEENNVEILIAELNDCTGHLFINHHL